MKSLLPAGLQFLRPLSRMIRPRQASARSAPAKPRAHLRVENLEERAVPAIITDMTQLAAQFGRHTGPSILYLNFDGSTTNGVSSFQSVSGDRNRDIHEILFRVNEVFAPFDVQVRRIYSNNNLDSSSNGNTTIFIGDKTSYGTGTTNGSGGYTPWSSSDFPSVGNKGTTHQPNSDAYDIAFVDPIYYSSSSAPNRSLGIGWITGAVAHEAGHAFGLVHVLSSPDPEVMSYDAGNTRFVNKAFNITSINYDPSTGTNVNSPMLQPKWTNKIYVAGTYIYYTSTITTQNSYTYLQTALGAAASSEWANVADRDSVDAAYVDGSQPTLGVGSSTTGGVGREGDWDVVRLNPGSSGWVRVNVSRFGTSSLDSVMMVYDSTGKYLSGFNDDRAGGDLNSELTFYASAGQSYKIVVGGYGANSTGNYQISTAWVNPWVVGPLNTAILLQTSSFAVAGGTGAGVMGAGVTSVTADPALAPRTQQPKQNRDLTATLSVTARSSAPRPQSQAALDYVFAQDLLETR